MVKNKLSLCENVFFQSIVISGIRCVGALVLWGLGVVDGCIQVIVNMRASVLCQVMLYDDDMTQCLQSYAWRLNVRLPDDSLSWFL